MGRDVSHDEIIEALGAYALDAVDAEEAEVIRRHLETCPSCAAEVLEHHQIAALLGNTGGEAPAHLWDEIAGRIGEQPPSSEYRAPMVDQVGPNRDRDNPAPVRALRVITRRPWALAAAAAVVAIALLSIQTVRLNDRVGTLNARNATNGLSNLANDAMASPGARTVSLVDSAGVQVTDAEVVILPSGTAYLLNKALPGLPSNQTYQLWGQTGSQLISLGILGSRPRTVAFNVGPAAHYNAYVVTAERAGGVVRSTHAPVAAGSVAT